MKGCWIFQTLVSPYRALRSFLVQTWNLGTTEDHQTSIWELSRPDISPLVCVRSFWNLLALQSKLRIILHALLPLPLNGYFQGTIDGWNSLMCIQDKYGPWKPSRYMYSTCRSGLERSGPIHIEKRALRSFGPITNSRLSGPPHSRFKKKILTAESSWIPCHFYIAFQWLSRGVQGQLGSKILALKLRKMVQGNGGEGQSLLERGKNCRTCMHV